MNNMKTITYKEARSFNRKLRNSWLADKIETEEYHAKKINIHRLVSDVLETDENLPVTLKAFFHLRNLNGVSASLTDEAKYGYELSYEGYHYRELKRLLSLSKPSKFNVDWNITELQKIVKERQEQAKACFPL